MKMSRCSTASCRCDVLCKLEGRRNARRVLLESMRERPLKSAGLDLVGVGCLEGNQFWHRERLMLVGVSHDAQGIP